MAAGLFRSLVITSLLRFLQAQSLLPFESFIEVHSRSYLTGSSEYEQRRSLYEQRVADAELHNSQPSRLWNAGVNNLWDWTEAELQTLRGWDGASTAEGSMRSARKHSSTFLQQVSDLPQEKIWDQLAMSKHVKDQKNCGSCWAIAAATVLEGHAEIYSGKARRFSSQQIVMCTPNPRHCGGDGGCQGATAELAMDFVMKHGLAEESEVPYTGHDGKCTMGSASKDMAMLLSGSGDSAHGGMSIGMTGWETLPKKQVCATFASTR